MKKKLIAIAIASVVAAPLTAQAAVKISGDAEFIMKNQTDIGWAGENRVRVKVDADMGGIGAHARLRARVGDSSSMTKSAGMMDNDVTTDYAYISTKAAGFTFKAGDQLATWGTKYFIDSATKMNRLSVIGKAGSAMYGLHLDPAYAAPADGGDGVAKFTLFGKMKMGNMMSAGLVHALKNEDAGMTDSVTDVYAMGSMAGINYGVEHNTAKNGGDGGTYLMVGMGVAGIDLALHFSDAQSDDDWSPVGIVNGVSDSSGAMDMAGNTGVGAGGFGEQMIITAGMKAAGWNLTVGAGSSAPVKDADAVSVIGVDAGTSMGAADFNIGFGSVDGDASMGFEFTTKF